LADAGVDPATLGNLNWNPQDGGTFEKLLAHLTVDVNGARGDEPGFDKARVKTHGIASDGSGGKGWGQTQWSAFAGSNGWQATDRNPWGTRFNLEDPKLQDTLSWYFGLVRKGYMPTYDEIGGSSNQAGTDKQVQTGLAAMAINGSWQISGFSSLTDAQGNPLEIGIAPKWVKYLSGSECQQIIGQSGVVFPARPEGTQLAIRYNNNDRKLDVSAFTEQVTDKTTFPPPVTTNAADIIALVSPRMDAIYIGSEPVSALNSTNDQLNRLFDVVSK
jgi:multiple sugar transport system substrate-binding protein